MTDIASTGPSKTHREENFPVASHLIHPRHRPVILAFYRFVRTADDIADSSRLTETEKLDGLDRLADTLIGKRDDAEDALPLRAVLAERSLATTHPLDVITAFRMDVTKLRYRDWDDLIHYCSYSAMPVGRFVLDVHGESRATWPANDALCAALQIINHLQDCGDDYRQLDRVYIPLDALARHRAEITDLGAAQSSPALLACIHDLAARTTRLLDDSRLFAAQIADLRLGLEVAVIQRVATSLTRTLTRRDPLSQKVHHGKAGFAGIGIAAATEEMIRRLIRAGLPTRKAQDA